MKKERFIYERHSKKNGKYLQVKIRKPGIDKTSFGIFYYNDYPTPSVCMEAARQCRDDALRDIKQNKVIVKTLTVREAYEQSKELLLHTVSTRERHDSLFNALIPDTLWNKKIEDVTASDIQRTINKFALTHNTEYTKRAMVIWRHIYKVAMLNEIPIIDRSTMVVIPKSKVIQRKNVTSCTHEELEIFLDCLATYGEGIPVAMHRREDLYRIIEVMRYLGLRPQEALGICNEDIDLVNRTIHICRSIGSNDTEKRVIIPPKTERSDRVLPIPKSLVPTIESAMQKSKQELLFVDTDGKPYSSSMLTRMMISVSKRNKCKRITLYMLRHMFSTDMLKATNNNSKLVQTMMGHEDASMTLHYADNASLEDMENALEKRKFS